MISDGQTTRCRFCGRLYVFYPYYAGDQSACGECVAKARGHVGITTTGTDAAADTATRTCPQCNGCGRVKQ